MTTQATLRSQVTLPDRNVAGMRGGSVTKKMNMDERASSLTSNAEHPLRVEKDIEHAEPLGCPDLRSKKSIWQNGSTSRQIDKANGTQRSLSVPSHVKPRQQLRLPSFKSLGRAPLYPDALLTPPDEATLIHWAPSPLGMSGLPTSEPTPQSTGTVSRATMPEALVFGGSIAEAKSNAPASAPAASLIPVQTTGKYDEGSASSSDDAPETPSWIEAVTQAIVSAVASTKGTSNVLNVLCHTQPCPLSEDVINVPTAFTPIITGLQDNVEPTNERYIEVTHAVPRKFDIACLPTSPIGTPSHQDASDYFSMMVYSKAVIAVDHHSASSNPYPSSPHPVVAPSSVGVSILERFIPPTTTAEYIDLFSNDGPSVLVDRLYELSADGGNLIFIYPTSNGAFTFTSKYLGPLLDPLLRTMVGVHGLSADLGADVGKMAVVDHMLSFENMGRKLTILLGKLNRGGSLGRSKPKYTLVHKKCENVQIDRKAWTNWWIHQEASRIREVLNRYFQRAVRLPQRETTAGTLMREILDGVETRAYTDYDARREGIEVGVFIVKRTA